MAHIHFVGIGGSGLSAIARFMLESGYIVSGSDRQLTPITEQLQQAGARIMVGHHPDHIVGADMVVRSSAVSDENDEVLAAQAAGIPVLKRADLFVNITQGKQVVAVAGTHGKTTTTAMLCWILTFIGLDPSFVIGGVSQNLGTNAHAGKGDFFVIEADEYDRMFLGLQPRIAVVTNIEYDHPDCFSTPENYFQAFEKFVQGIEENGILVASINDPGSTRLLHQQGKLRIKPVSFGIRSDSSQTQPDYVARDLTLNDWGGYRFSIIKNNAELTVVSLRVPGEHNVRNALATLAVTDQLGLSISEAVRALGAFQGTGRRFEVLGEVAGIVVIDDYAHHPSEIRATLAGARSRFTGRSLWAVWQPHTFSRTQLFFNDFANAYKDADHVLVTEVYGAREKSSTGFSAERIVKVMDHPDAHFIHGVREATEYLLNQLKSGDVLLVLSAGDGNQISANIVESLSIDRSAAHA